MLFSGTIIILMTHHFINFNIFRSISFTSRKEARIRKDFVHPGEYTLLIAPLKTITALTINISILPVTHKGAGNPYWRPRPVKKDPQRNLFNVP